MELTNYIERPQELPFLKAICWDLTDVNVLNEDEILNRYERGWIYRGALADLGDEERVFIAEIAKCKGSWLAVDV